MTNPKKLSTRSKIVVALLIFSLIAAISGLLLMNRDDTPEPKQKPLQTIMTILTDEKKSSSVKEVTIEDAHRTVTLDFKDKTKPDFYSSYPTDFGSEILEAANKTDTKVTVSNNFGGQSIWMSILGLLPMLLLIGVLVWFVLTSMGGLKSSKPVAERPNVRFNDVAGAKEAKEDLQEVVDFLRDSSRFRAMGAKTPKGVLLSGPPGVGKTLLAKAVAGEAEVPFFAESGSNFIEMFVGLGARRVRNLFKEAKKYPAAIIFIDELDAVGGQRKGSEGAEAGEHNRTVNALLTEMDGFEENNIIVIAATNNPGQLDTALTRAGRFDRKAVVHMPDWKDRLAILGIHTKGKPLGEDVDLEVLAKSTTGLSGADLANLVNEALINAAREGKTRAGQADFMEALSIITIGKARTGAVMTKRDRDVISWHESGHATVALALDELPDPTHVTIIPRGDSGGHTKLQESEDQFQTSAMLKARLAMILGGYAAENLIYNDITQGPGSDLQVGTKLAQDMVAKMAMGGTLSVIADQSIIVNPGVSADVRERTEALLTEAAEVAKEILMTPKWQKVFYAMGEKLLEVDSIEIEEIQELKRLASG